MKVKLAMCISHECVCSDACAPSRAAVSNSDHKKVPFSKDVPVEHPLHTKKVTGFIYLAVMLPVKAGFNISCPIKLKLLGI